MTAGDARLDAIQERLDAASDGPMDAVLSANRKWALVLVNPGTADERTLAKVVDDDDAWLYANAPADMAFLFAELREAREALTRAWDEGCTAALMAEGYSATAHAAIFRSNPYRVAVAAANADGQHIPGSSAAECPCQECRDCCATFAPDWKEPR